MAVPPSILARKYGILPAADDPAGDFAPRGKSGYTPLSPIAITLKTPEERRVYNEKRGRMEDIQRRLFLGFTALQIHTSGGYPDPEATSLGLATSHIHPIFKFKNWETANNIIAPRHLLPLVANGRHYSLGPDNTGFWTAANPVVWKALQPILRLTSRFLSVMLDSQWMDALLNGERRNIPANLDTRTDREKYDTELGGKVTFLPLQTFHTRKPGVWDPTQTAKDAEALFKTIETMLILTFSSKNVSLDDNKTPQKSGGGMHDTSLATTRPYPLHEMMPNGLRFVTDIRKIYVNLQTDIMLPLLRNDLSASEILAEQYFVAFILVHEVAHVINLARLRKRDLNGGVREPYFGGDENGIGGESFAELGFSLTNAYFGGHTDPFVRPNDLRPSRPHLGFFLNNFPTIFGFQNRFPLLVSDDQLPPRRVDVYRSKHFENTQIDDFWTYAATKWGREIIRPYVTNVHLIHSRSEWKFSNTASFPLPAYITDLIKTTAEVKNGFAVMKPTDREAYRIAKDSYDQIERVRTQLEVRVSRGKAARKVNEALDQVEKEYKLVGRGPANPLVQQVKLIELLEDEVHGQLEEVQNFLPNGRATDPDHIQHRAWLLRSNRHCRELIQSLNDDIVRFHDPNLLLRTARMIKCLEGCVHMLRGGTFIEADDIDSFNRRLDNLNAASVNLSMTREKRLLDPGDALIEKVEVDNIIQAQGSAAILASDADKCRELGLKLLDSIHRNLFRRAVALVLLAQSPNEKRRTAMGVAGLQALDALTGEDPRLVYMWRLHANAVIARNRTLDMTEAWRNSYSHMVGGNKSDELGDDPMILV